MRISDWSSDVCSSDLRADLADRVTATVATECQTKNRRIATMQHAPAATGVVTAQYQPELAGNRDLAIVGPRAPRHQREGVVGFHGCGSSAAGDEIGRASRRERVCLYV